MIYLNTDKSDHKSKIELAFPKVEEHDDYVSKGGTKEMLSLFSASVDEVTEWFRNYQVESIEMWISGIIETSGITKLLISAKGEGGMKVSLKPKQQP
jgi:hypothetical protein